MGSNLNQERIDDGHKRTVVETYISSNHNHTQIILPLYEQQYCTFDMYCITVLTKTAVLTSKQMHIYCKLHTAICFNEILV